jgi:hypothetical protein
MIALLGLTVPIVFGLTSFAIMGLYAALPLFTVPVMNRIIVREQADVRSVIPLFLRKKVILSVCFFIISYTIFAAHLNPRPRSFFIALAIVPAVTLVYGLENRSVIAPIILSSIVVVVFHTSTSLTNSFYLSSGDIISMVVSTQNIMEQSSTSSIIAGYDSYPNMFITTSFIGELIGVRARTAVLIFTAAVQAMAVWFIAMLSIRLKLLSKQFVAAPVVIISITPVFNYMGLLSLPRTVFSLLAIVPFAIIFGASFTKRVPPVQERISLNIWTLFHSDSIKRPDQCGFDTTYKKYCECERPHWGMFKFSFADSVYIVCHRICLHFT